MKLKNISTFILLFILSFSVFHEIEFAVYDKKPCDVVEYISEFAAPTNCGDICDIHYEYHHNYILPQYNFLSQINSTNFFTLPKDDIYHFKTYLKTIKPPTV